MARDKQKDLEKECEVILRSLISKHAFLQPANELFDVWDANNAKEVVADLIEMINKSSDIEDAHNERDWGK